MVMARRCVNRTSPLHGILRETGQSIFAQLISLRRAKGGYQIHFSFLREA